MNDLAHQKKLLLDVIKIAHQAAEKILEIYSHPTEVTYKKDHSPVTLADKAANDIILAGLKALTPNILVISEEEEANHQYTGEEFWLVDPLDGTKEFIRKSGEFTVNIALIKNHIPVLGVICAPVLKVTYAGIVNDGAFRISNDEPSLAIQASSPANDQVIVVGSRSHGDPEHTEKFLKSFPEHKFISAGSSLKFCKLAEGTAHVYPRFGRTMEWDTAAGQAILMAAGGGVFSVESTNMLSYGKKGYENPHFIAVSSKTLFTGGLSRGT